MDEKEIRNSLKKCKDGISKYLKIMEMFHKVNVANDKDFQQLYNNFYKMRHPQTEFYTEYYSYMERNKNNTLSYLDVLEYFKKYGRLEFSFSSKLLATIDPTLPIWDKYVLQNLNLTVPHGNDKENKANVIYNNIIQWYKDYKNTPEAKKCITLFDEYYPNNNITPIKKLDFIFWQARS
jgi:hypothetical protein